MVKCYNFTIGGKVKMKELKGKEKSKNVAIELWRFIIAVAIIGFHVGFIIARTCNGTNGYYMTPEAKWFFGSSEVLLIFTLTAGYFMVAHHEKRKDNPEYASQSPSRRAWDYTWARVKTLLPTLVLGYILGVIFCTKFYYPDYNLQQVLMMIVNSAWEFLGFHAAGLRSTGNEFFNLNGPLWFISAIIIVGYFLYYLLCKNKDLLMGFIAPFGTIFFAGWWCFTGTRAAQTAWSTFGLQTASTNGMGGAATSQTATLGFNNGLIFVMIGLLGGIIIYNLVNELKKHKFTKIEQIAMTVLNAFCSALLIWYTIYQPTYFNLERWTVALLIFVVITLSLLNKDFLTNLLNNKYTNKVFAYLGSISLEIYMLHYPIAIFVLRMLGKNSETNPYTFWQIFIPTAVLTVIFSAILSIIRKAVKMYKTK